MTQDFCHSCGRNNPPYRDGLCGICRWIDIPQFPGLQVRESALLATDYEFRREIQPSLPIHTSRDGQGVLYVLACREDRDHPEEWPASYLVGLAFPHLAEE